MVTVQKEGIILKKANREIESHGMMKPAAIQKGKYIHLYNRAVGRGHQSIRRDFQPIGFKLGADHWQRPMMVPAQALERNRLENPLIGNIENQHHLTYLGFNGFNDHAAWSISENVFYFIKMGIITPPSSSMILLLGPGQDIRSRYFPQVPPNLAISCISSIVLPGKA